MAIIIFVMLLVCTTITIRQGRLGSLQDSNSLTAFPTMDDLPLLDNPRYGHCCTWRSHVVEPAYRRLAFLGFLGVYIFLFPDRRRRNRVYVIGVLVPLRNTFGLQTSIQSSE